MADRTRVYTLATAVETRARLCDGLAGNGEAALAALAAARARVCTRGVQPRAATRLHRLAALLPTRQKAVGMDRAARPSHLNGLSPCPSRT